MGTDPKAPLQKALVTKNGDLKCPVCGFVVTWNPRKYVLARGIGNCTMGILAGVPYRKGHDFVIDDEIFLKVEEIKVRMHALTIRTGKQMLKNFEETVEKSPVDELFHGPF